MIVRPDRVTLPPGRIAQATLTLSNPRPEPVSVRRIETSCPCVGVSPDSIEVGPGGSADLTVAFDPAEEPDFRGGLSVRIRGMGSDGAILFEARVDVEVADEANGSGPDLGKTAPDRSIGGTTS